MRETLKQPNGSTVYIDAIPESGSCYSKEEMDNGIKNTFIYLQESKKANILLEVPKH